MLANLFKDIGVLSVGRALFASLLVLLGYVIFFPVEEASFEMASQSWRVSPLIYKISLVLTILLTAWWFNQRINNFGFLKNDLQSTPIFVLLALPILSVDARLEYLLILPGGLFLTSRLLSMAWGAVQQYVLFDVGVLTGLMVLLVPESLIIIAIAWLGIMNFGSFYFRSLLMPLTGLLAIWFLLFSFAWLYFGIPLSEQLQLVFGDFQLAFDQAELSDYGWRYLPLLLLLLPALFQTVQVYTKANMYKKQVFSFMLIMLLIILAAGLFVENNLGLLLWLCFPFTVLLSNLVHYSKKWWTKDLVYLGLLGFLLLSLF